ncbi:Nn.00g103580.m01.CDS01 [Neocucurbitaria sp. VM-36]
MGFTKSPIPSQGDVDSTPLPSYLARHVHLGFNTDDLTALVTSIDSSQSPRPSSAPHLPAELVLCVLEHVPIDYVLDWRLVCRGFRDAIDGRVLFHCLQRTQLIGYMGSRLSRHMEGLDDEQYEQIYLLHARFQHIETSGEDDAGGRRSRPIWSETHAVFRIEDDWFRSFRQIGGAAARRGDTIEDADTQWLDTLDRLELRRPEEGFGTLRWCIKLDHSVLDMDFPLETGRNAFDVDVHLHTKSIRVGWKDMLVRSLKTETALRRLMEEKQDSLFTFSHAEDCLRAVRRQRLQSTLDADDRVDRHIKWSLRLLHPLFGKPRHDHHIILEDVENDATNLLLLLRREASMNSRQLSYLRQLALEYEAMDVEVHELDQAFKEFKSHLSLPGFHFSVSLPGLDPCKPARNPLSWSDDLIAKVEAQVGKWKSQKQTIEKIKGLLSVSNEALTLPDDSFDDLGSDF